MKTIPSLLVALSACVPMALAEDFVLVNGTKIVGTLSRVEPNGLVVETDSGIEKIAFVDLTDADRKKHGFDAKKAQDFAAEQEKARLTRLKRDQSNFAKEEALKTGAQAQASASESLVKIKDQGLLAHGEIIQSNKEGARVRMSLLYGRSAPTMLNKDTRGESETRECFVYGVSGADGDLWEGTVYNVGIYDYETTSGSNRSLHAFALSPESALRLRSSGK